MTGISDGLYLDASDLGMSPDAEGYHEFLEDIGSAPPWTLQTLQGYFDRRYAGWDDPPKLQLGSPVRRLQYLDQALRSADPNLDEPLRVLDEEVKNALLRTLLKKEDGLSDEVSFLILLVGELGAHLYDEREHRKNDRHQAEQAALLAAESNRAALEEQRDRAQQQVEELNLEAEAQRLKTERLQQELLFLKGAAESGEEMAMEVQELRAHSLRLSSELEQLAVDLREAKAAKAALVVAHEESEGALDELSRRLQHAQLGGTVSEDAAKLQVAQVKKQVSSRWLEAAAMKFTVQQPEKLLRSTFLGWRLARLEAKLAGLSEESLQVELSLTHATGCKVEGCCCRRQAGLAPCCRKAQVASLQEALEKARLQPAGPAKARGGKVVSALVPVLMAAIALHYEPYMSGGF
ncbi:unnamed protein product [Effrenium voratum]|nr:unnamed protein product [Effrenium voratum]